MQRDARLHGLNLSGACEAHAEPSQAKNELGGRDARTQGYVRTSASGV